MFSTTNVSEKWNVRGFERMLSYEQYPEEKSCLWLSSKKKKLIKLHGGQLDVATNIYLKSCTYHADSAALVQNAAPSFMEVLAIRSPLKVHCYTCMSFKTCWSRRIYTKLSSHRSFVIKCTLSRCCISPWSFYRSLRRRREMDIFHKL